MKFRRRLKGKSAKFIVEAPPERRPALESSSDAVNDPKAFCESIIPPDSFDEIDLTVDPLVERFARPRKESQAARLFDIFDQLERSGRE